MFGFKTAREFVKFLIVDLHVVSVGVTAKCLYDDIGQKDRIQAANPGRELVLKQQPGLFGKMTWVVKAEEAVVPSFPSSIKPK